MVHFSRILSASYTARYSVKIVLFISQSKKKFSVSPRSSLFLCNQPDSSCQVFRFTKGREQPSRSQAILNPMSWNAFLERREIISYHICVRVKPFIAMVR